MPRFLVDNSLCIHHKLVDYVSLLNMKILKWIHDYQLLEQRTWEVGSLKFLEELESPQHSQKKEHESVC
jgi:hypothetical protein